LSQKLLVGAVQVGARQFRQTEAVSVVNKSLSPLERDAIELLATGHVYKEILPPFPAQ
jgi:DNA-binding CsgD family transcriptional regulator